MVSASHTPHSPESNHGHGAVAHTHEKHSTVRSYILISIVLCAITYTEYHIFTIESLRTNRAFMLPTLLILSAIKFVLVVGYYMHLRFDNKILIGVFVFSLFLAAGVMGILGVLLM